MVGPEIALSSVFKLGHFLEWSFGILVDMMDLDRLAGRLLYGWISTLRRRIYEIIIEPTLHSLADEAIILPATIMHHELAIAHGKR